MEDLNSNFFCYKGKPLVRNGNTIYYGSMLDDYVVMLQVLNTNKTDELELSNTILVQLMRTDKDIKPQDIIVKKREKVGLYNALDTADIWLTKALAE